jgi:ADP-ribose pyrophosphatase YjhB (NUDIX family)
VGGVTLPEDLVAEGEAEAEFVPGVAARMPRKRVAAAALIRDEAGRVLLVEPVYKPTWDLPGGVVEADESPLEACRREVREELGLALLPQRLLAVDWVPQQGVWHDALVFVFDGGTLPADRLSTLPVPPDELAAAHLVDPEEARPRLRPSAYRRLRSALDVLASGEPAPAYLHFGRRALPS